MQAVQHADHLRLLNSIVEPIAQSLGYQLGNSVDKNVADNKSSKSKRSFAIDRSDTDLSGDFENFFAQDSSLSVSPQSENLSANAPDVDGKPVGRLFEYLRQVVLVNSTKEFSSLSLRTQAIARIGGLIYTERQNFQPRSYLLTANGETLGMLDCRKSRLYIQKNIQVTELSDLHSVPLARGVDTPSDDMESMPILDVLWHYGAFDPESLLDLPASLGTNYLQLCKLPAISPGLLLERHLTLIRLLLVRENSFDILLQGTKRHNHTYLLRDLTCLLLTRAIEIMPSVAVKVTSQSLKIPTKATAT